MSIQHRRLQVQLDEKNARIAQLEAELAEARAQYTAACTKLAEAQHTDIPDNDGTSYAHPAWWRGQEAGDRYRLADVVTELSLLLGVEITTDELPERWEALKQIVKEARKDSERLEKAEKHRLDIRHRPMFAPGKEHWEIVTSHLHPMHRQYFRGKTLRAAIDNAIVARGAK